jgi:outer membrane protein assembly factor BamB
MSRNRILLLVVILLAAGAGIAWYYLRGKSGELDIPVNKDLAELPPAKFGSNDWPWWRGPARDGHSPDQAAPTKWSETENIAWKTAIPGRGYSSPVVLGNRIFLTTADEESKKQIAMALDRGSGKILWEKTIHEGNLGAKHGDNSYASGTPCTDGERLFVCFQNNGAIHVSALHLDDGRVLWSKNAGPHSKSDGWFGTGTSLALWGSFVYICDDSPGVGIERAKGWIAALYRSTGEFGWRTERKAGAGSYGSPVVADLNGKLHLLIAGSGSITAYDPKEGKELWSREGIGETSANTVAFSPTMVFGSSGYSRGMMAVRSDGTLAWKKQDSTGPYVPSPIWSDGLLYIVTDEGRLNCCVPETGVAKWSERLAEGHYYSSPILVGKHIYASNRRGVTTVVEVNADGMSEVARNKLEAGINATPVAVGGKLYLRTETHLYCIGN